MVEKKLILEHLEFHEGNKHAAAKTLGITVKTIYNKLHQYGLFDQYRANTQRSA